MGKISQDQCFVDRHYLQVIMVTEVKVSKLVNNEIRTAGCFHFHSNPPSNYLVPIDVFGEASSKLIFKKKKDFGQYQSLLPMNVPQSTSIVVSQISCQTTCTHTDTHRKNYSNNLLFLFFCSWVNICFHD